MNIKKLFSRLINMVFFAMLLFNFSSIQAQKFITIWKFSESTTKIKFNAKTEGLVDYEWIANPSGNSGTGSFDDGTEGFVSLSVNIAANDIVELRMTPTNLRRFFMDFASSRLNLIKVNQWGSVPWSSMNSSFMGCENLISIPSGVPNLTNVTDMSYMFSGAKSFNQDMSHWNTATITDMNHMFFGANSFNQPIRHWNTTKVNNMSHMFYGATSFNQNLGHWPLFAYPDLENMLSNSGMDCGNYSATLIGWSGINSSIKNLKLGALCCKYGTNAIPARNALKFTQNWAITGDTPSGEACYASENGDPCDGCGNDGLPVSSSSDISTQSTNEYFGDKNSIQAQHFEDEGSSQQNFLVYPNPLSSSKALHIVISGVELSPEATVRLRDMQGRAVLQQTLNAQNDLQLNGLCTGVYLLEATDGKAVWRERVVVVQ